MDENNKPIESAPDSRPSAHTRGFLMVHVTNLALIAIIFFGTHYFLKANNCTPEVSFRVSAAAAVLYGLLSTMLVVSWVRRNRK